MLKSKINFRITKWLDERERPWLETEKARIKKETVIRTNESGHLALFYKHVKDFPELITPNSKEDYPCRY